MALSMVSIQADITLSNQRERQENRIVSRRIISVRKYCGIRFAMSLVFAFWLPPDIACAASL